MHKYLLKILFFILVAFAANTGYAQIDDVRVVDNKGTIVNIPISPIKAFGKINSDGSIAKASAGITITKLAGNGHYQVNIAAAIGITDADYIIQLTIPRKNLVTSGSNNNLNDDPGVVYLNQTSTTFEVMTGDNDNGGTDKNLYNSEFMFVILDM